MNADRAVLLPGVIYNYYQYGFEREINGTVNIDIENGERKTGGETSTRKYKNKKYWNCKREGLILWEQSEAEQTKIDLTTVERWGNAGGTSGTRKTRC